MNAPPSPRALLVIDNDPLIVALVRRHLRASAVTITGVGDARGALAHLVRGQPDVVLCDAQLADDHGTRCHDLLAAAYPHLVPRLVLMGGAARDRFAIPKPPTQDALVAALRTLAHAA